MQPKINDTIFDTISINRSKSRWEEHLYDMVPVQELTHPITGQTMKFKRGDFFAPLGYGGINGDKLRVAIHIMNEHAKRGGDKVLAHGTVMGSPQSPMAAAVARHFGYKTVTVLGGTKPETCIKKDTIQMTAWFGSDFAFVGNGYNNVIQPRVQKILSEKAPSGLYLEYGITLDHRKHEAARIAAFHGVGAEQVKNIPDDVDTLIIPFGSANSGTSILLGLCKYPKPNIKEVVLVGIGPNRVKFMQERLKVIGDHLGINTDMFDLTEMDKPKEDANTANVMDFFGAETKPTGRGKYYRLTHFDLHTTKYVEYNDLMEYSWGELELHPRYEGKVMTYLQEKHPEYIRPSSLFWIVGSKPRLEPMMANVGHEIQPEVPTAVELLEKAA